jgi:mycofactocin precursor
VTGGTPASATGPEARLDRPADPSPHDWLGEELVLEDLLVEDVSIDGMCGIY